MRNNSPSLVVPYIVSITLHLLFFGWVIFNPAPKTELPFRRDQVIDVSMVTMKETAGSAPAAKEKVAEKEAAAKPAPPKEPPPEDAVSIPSEPEPEPPAEEKAPVEPAKPKVKTSLKKKTFKPKEVKKPVQKVKKPAETPKEDSVSDALRKLQEKVKADEQSGRHKTNALGGSTQGTGDSSAAGRRRAEMIDLYRFEIAQRVQKNWAFSEQLAGPDKNLMASLVFKVMPNGEIRDIFFIDRSGNEYLDDSAYRAVSKTNPAPPHPKGLVESFVDVGLRFTPEGIR